MGTSTSATDVSASVQRHHPLSPEGASWGPRLSFRDRGAMTKHWLNRRSRRPKRARGKEHPLWTRLLTAL
eukprot:13748596-Alexandrium_andersonii.AAC.1